MVLGLLGFRSDHGGPTSKLISLGFGIPEVKQQVSCVEALLMNFQHQKNKLCF